MNKYKLTLIHRKIQSTARARTTFRKYYQPVENAFYIGIYSRFHVSEIKFENHMSYDLRIDDVSSQNITILYYF